MQFKTIKNEPEPNNSIFISCFPIFLSFLPSLTILASFYKISSLQSLEFENKKMKSSSQDLVFG